MHNHTAATSNDHATRNAIVAVLAIAALTAGMALHTPASRGRADTRVLDAARAAQGSVEERTQSVEEASRLVALVAHGLAGRAY